MAVSRAPIVPPPTPLRGRPTAVDIEERNPAGRWLHQLERRIHGIAATCLRGRDAHPLWLQHDAMCDETVRANQQIARQMIEHPDPQVQSWGLAMVGNCAVYWRVDASEDACTSGLFGLLAEIHEAAKRIGGWIERSCTAIRSRR